MRITKAVITAAGRKQRTLPLQTLIDRDGVEKSVLHILVEEVLAAGVDEICVVVRPGDETAYAEVAGDHAGRLRFVQQAEPLGYGHAVYCAAGVCRGAIPFCTWSAITSTSAATRAELRPAAGGRRRGRSLHRLGRAGHAREPAALLRRRRRPSPLTRRAGSIPRSRR